MYIYCITNILNHKKYIGQTVRPLELRFTEHCKPSRQKVSALSLAIQKYGKNNFTIELLQLANTQKQLNTLEQNFIKTLKTLAPNGYNLTTGGEHPEFTQEELTLRKLRRKNQLPPTKGMKQNSEWVLKRVLSRQKTLLKKKIPRLPKIKETDNLNLAKPVIKNNTEFFISINQAAKSGYGQKEISMCCKNIKNKTKNSTFRYATIDEIKFYLNNDTYKINKILNNKHFMLSLKE